MIQESTSRLIVALAMGLLMVGCSTPSTKPDQAENAKAGATVSDSVKKVVEKRAVERWELLIAHNAEKAYDFLSPGYRATKKRDEYAEEMNNRPVQWKKVLPYSQQCDKPDVCVVNMQIDAGVSMPGVGKVVSSVGFVTETWIRARGNWYFLPDSNNVAGRK